MRSQSSLSVHNRRQERHFHRNRPLLRVLLEAAGVMTLIMGVIATSPAGGDRAQQREVAHDFELVDFQPLDTGDDGMMDDEMMMEEPNDGTSEEPSMEGSDEDTSDEPSMDETQTSDVPATFENCDEAFAAGESNIPVGDPQYAEHLDGDNDGTACEGPAVPENPTMPYENCTEARADGATDIPESDPAYAEHLDGDNDGVACER
jgi:hypothetical protein